MLVLVNFLDGAETFILPGTLSLLQDDFGFGDTLAGALATAAALAGLIVVLPAGYLADHFRRTRVLAIVVTLWSALSVLSAAAVAFWMFFAARFAMGAANSVDNPPASSLLADFYPPISRGRIFAVQRVAWSVGVGVGVAVGGAVGEALGWRAAYLVFVIPGLFVALLAWLLAEPTRGQFDHVRRPGTEPEHPAPEELAVEMELSETTPTRRSAREFVADARTLARIPTARHFYIGLAITFAGFNGIAFWIPSFLEREHDLGEAAAGAITGGLILFVALTGALLGGALGDRAASSGSGGRARIVGTTLAGGAVVGAVAFLFDALGPLLVLLAVASFVISMAIPNFAAVIAEVIPAARRGTGFSIYYFLTILGGAVGPLLIGVVSDLTDSLQLAMAASFLPAIPGGWYVYLAHRTLEDDATAALAPVS